MHASKEKPPFGRVECDPARVIWLAMFATLWSSLGCDSEVTIRFFTNDVASLGTRDAQFADGGNASLDGAAAVDAAGGDSSFRPPEAGLPPASCQKLGAEVCNGADDDCDGVADEGCSFTIAWTPEPDGPAVGHQVGGVIFVEPCLEGAVLTGLHVGVGSWLNQVAAVCRQIALQPEASRFVVQFATALGPRLDTSMAPFLSQDPRNKVQDLLCPDGSVVTGLDGTTSTDQNRYVLGIRIHCAPPVVVQSASGPVLDTDRAQEKLSGPVVCVDCAPTQAFDFAFTVSAAQIPTRLFGGDGQRVDRVGIGTSLASVMPK